MKVRNRIITGYSGLRAIAVIGVILYHIDPTRFIGGYLGVPIFLILTGYLETDHMFHSYEETGSYDNKSYYLRRAKRLYPQLIAVLWLSSAYILLFQQNLLAKLHEIVISNLLNVYNIWQIFNGQSYFARFAANESPFVHLWTMSIDGQFYLIWPLVIFLLFRFVKRKKTTLLLFTAFTLFSALEMAVLYQPGVDTSRIYYGTDTRFFSLGLGAMLAVVWPTWHLREFVSKKDSLLLDLVGALGLLGVLWLILSPAVDPTQAFAYRGGIFLFSLITTILVGVIAHPGSHWSKWLTNPVFDWLGSRSYAIYLYQFPIMIFFEDKVQNLADHVILYRVIEVVLILLVSEVTYRLIERPLRHITWAQTWDFLTRLFSFNKESTLQRLNSVLAAIVLLLGSIAIIKAPTVKAADPNNSPLAKQIRKNRRQQLKDNKKLIAEAKKRQKDEQVNKVQVNKSQVLRDAEQAAKTHPVNTDWEKDGISQFDLQLAQKVQATSIGDSVMAGSSQNLKTLMPNLVVDAAVSRQLVPSIALFQQYKNQGALNQNVIVGLGTNGPFHLEDIDRLMQVIGPDRKVFWINVHVPDRQWQGPVNALLIQARAKYKNLVIIDWHYFSQNHPDWFYEDHTHPNPGGSRFYSAFVTKSIVEQAKY